MSSNNIFIEHQKHLEPPHQSVRQFLSDKMNRGIKSTYAGSAQQSLRYQKVYEKNKHKKNQLTRKISSHNVTPFSEKLKLKKGTIILIISVFIVFISSLPITTNIKSYFWEKKRILFSEKNVLYDLFLVEGGSVHFEDSENRSDEQMSTAVTIPSLILRSYTVKKGDSLFSIARRFNVSIDTVISANNLKNAYYLRIGTVLKIPNMSGIFYTVKKGDNLSTITAKYRVSINKVADINDLSTSVIHIGQVVFIPGGTLSDWERASAIGNLFQKPTKGRLASKMGFRIDPFTGKMAYHTGIDIANKTGTPVYASQFGRVIFTGYKGNYGKMVIIKHLQGYSTLYGHLNKILVKRGQVVRQGEKIGKMGNTGRSTGPHLHFEVHQNNKLLNPLKVLRMR